MEPYTICFHSPEECDHSVISEGNLQKRKLPFEDSEIFESPVVYAKLLSQCSDDDIADVYVIWIQLTTNCSRKYKPGDTIGIIPKNAEEEVLNIVRRLDLLDKVDHICTIVSNGNSKVPPHIPKCGSSVREIFMKYLDIRGVPSKLFLKALISQTNDSDEIRRLNELCTPGNSAKYAEFVNTEGRTLLTLLQAFPFCRPTLSILVKYLPSLRPRPYSISNSYWPDKIAVTFSVRKKSRGVCSGYLEQISRDIKGEGPSALIQYYFRKPTNFRLPEDRDNPIILIGTGTGLAPFVGFLDERACALINSTCWLYYGCRHENQDYIYKADLAKHSASGSLSKVYTAFSRDTDKKVYVQHRIKETGQDFVNLIREGAIIYICGEAKTMMADVRQTVMECLMEFDGVSNEQAVATLKNMEVTNRYIEDKWI